MWPELDCACADERAIGLSAGDEDRLHVSVSGATNTCNREPLLAPQLVLDPRGTPATGEVGRAEPLGDDALKAEFLDSRGEVLAPLDDNARRRSPGGPLERELLEQRSAFRVGEDSGRVAVEMKDIEHLKHCRIATIG